MTDFLGEAQVEGSPFDSYQRSDWALRCIEEYGGIDGDHHKAWVLDHVARILHGTPVVVSLARWSDGTTEYRWYTGEPSEEYKAWVASMEVDGYEYDPGIPP